MDSKVKATLRWRPTVIATLRLLIVIIYSDATWNAENGLHDKAIVLAVVGIVVLAVYAVLDPETVFQPLLNLYARLQYVKIGKEMDVKTVRDFLEELKVDSGITDSKR